MKALDAAIGISELVQASSFHAAHGNGLGVRGSLLGDPKAFVGLIYQYPGYISTSSDAQFRDRFLKPRRSASSRPAILKFHLPAVFNAIDMHHGGHAGECEFLLGRNLAFRIVDAAIVDGDVISLVLEP